MNKKIPRIPFLDSFSDRYGVKHYYFRPVRGGGRIALPSPKTRDPREDQEFWAEYTKLAATFSTKEQRDIFEQSDADRRGRAYGMIYVIGYDYYVKIGFTRNLKKRLASLSQTCPRKLRVYFTLRGSMKEERRLHEHFKECRLDREWFEYRGKLGKWIEDMRGRATRPHKRILDAPDVGQPIISH